MSVAKALTAAGWNSDTVESLAATSVQHTTGCV